jgi:hypothetical protein
MQVIAFDSKLDIINTWTPCCYTLSLKIDLINWKKWIDFVKIKFHLNENIEWHCTQLEFELDSDLTELISNS